MSSAAAGGRSRDAGAAGADRRGDAWRVRSFAANAAESPIATYYLLLGTTVTLTLFGLVMVFSASSVTSIIKDHSMTAIFLKQLQYAVIGGLACLVASRLSVRTWKHLAPVALLLGVILQVAVLFTPLGKTVNGNRNWLRLPGFQLQPSEFAKIGLVLVGALVLANRRKQLWQARAAVVPYLFPYALVSMGLVLAGGDLGTVLVLVSIVAAALFVGGVPGRYFAATAGLGAAALVGFVVTSSHRMARFQAVLRGCTDINDAQCYQSMHGRDALAGGGWWGVGLGGSKEKWAWLPEAHNDFIFAVIGEELGLPGTLAVLLLFALMAWACARLVMRSNDQFVRIASGAIMAWIVVQAMVNIGSVIGLLPVIGVPLPLISAGGTSLITTLIAVGMLLSFARNEPGAQRLLAARPKIWQRSVSVLPRRVPREAPRGAESGKRRVRPTRGSTHDSSTRRGSTRGTTTGRGSNRGRRPRS